jgi:hypothetical protein
MADVRKVYIDSCCFIDMVKTKLGRKLATEREKDVWHLKSLLEANRDGEVRVFTSTFTIAECSHDGDGKISDAVKNEFSRFLMSGQYVVLVQLTPFIAQRARDLRWTYGLALKPADSVHVASAMEMECEEFLSSDVKLERLLKAKAALTKIGLPVRGGRETQCLPMKYRQLELENGKNGKNSKIH